MLKDLDREGPFLQNQAGEFLPEHFVKLKRIIGQHAHQHFNKQNIALSKERIEALKAEKAELYKEKVIWGLQHYGYCLQ